MAQPVFRYLRTKSFYTAEKNDTTLTEEKPGRSFWCVRSVSGIGPDDKVVGPTECDAHRTCFETVDVRFV